MKQYELNTAGNLFDNVGTIPRVTPAYKWEQDRFLRHIILGDPDEPTHHRTASLMLRKLGVEMGRQDLPIEVKRTLLNFFEGMAL